MYIILRTILFVMLAFITYPLGLKSVLVPIIALGLMMTVLMEEHQR